MPTAPTIAERLTAAQQARRVARERALDRFYAAHPDLAILSYPEVLAREPFALGVAATVSRWQQITPRQAAAVRRALRSHIITLNLTAALTVPGESLPVEAGRYEIHGTIAHVYTAIAASGDPYRRMRIVTPSGQVLTGTLPASISTAEVGDQIALTATVTPGEPGVGWLARPTGASITNRDTPA